MKGTIEGGDWVAIDMFDKGVGQGGVFALRDCTGEVIVKRVRWVRGSDPQKIELISDNPKQGSETEFLSKIEIIGRVIGRTTRSAFDNIIRPALQRRAGFHRRALEALL